MDYDDSNALHPRKNLEEEYLNYEAKIISTFSVVDSMREQLYSQQPAFHRKDDTRIIELFEDIEKLRKEFESIKRPILEIETLQTPKLEAMSEKSLSSPPSNSTPEGSSPKPDSDAQPEEPAIAKQQVLDPAAELAKLESEFGKDARDYSAEEINDWEFDELERELRSGNTTSK